MSGLMLIIVFIKQANYHFPRQNIMHAMQIKSHQAATHYPSIHGLDFQKSSLMISIYSSFNTYFLGRFFVFVFLGIVSVGVEDAETLSARDTSLSSKRSVVGDSGAGGE